MKKEKIKCPLCKNKDLEFNTQRKEYICRDCRFIVGENFFQSKDKKPGKFVSGLATKAGRIICPVCKKEAVYHNESVHFCINCRHRLTKKEIKSANEEENYNINAKHAESKKTRFLLRLRNLLCS
jgi:transcription initiation factor TFIIIB Brf1 subunit/transcription initiation factor TFIIB